MIPGFLREAAKHFSEKGAPLYLVGGWPRNRLLNLPPGDLDVSSALPPDQAAGLFERVPGARVIERNTRLGTFGVLYEDVQAEYTAFRTESYGEGGAHRPEQVCFGATMEQDALRRDFTVNAIYHDIAAGHDIDPLAGLPDIAARQLRTCRSPAETFADDGLRLMRLARFAAELDFSIEKETYAAARDNAALIDDIVPERVQAELFKILLADTKYRDLARAQSPVLKGLHLLDDLGLLPRILPELEPCRGVGQRADYHDHDVLEHLLRAASCAPPELPLRLAALLHDVGKPEALRSGGRMVGHDKLGEPIARAILTRLRCPNRLIDEVAALVRWHMADLDGKTGEKRLRLFFVKMGRERARGLAELRRADVWGSKVTPESGDPAGRWVALLDRMEQEHVPWTQRDLDLDGSALADLAGGPSPLVGALKAELHRHAVLRPQDNTKAKLLRLAAALMHDSQRLERILKK